MIGLLALIAAVVPSPDLVVCADPNNLPFSNQAGEGFENEVAEIVAHDLGRRVRYVWWAQRRGYVRNTLGEAKCDIWPGVASGVEMVATTRPWYRSTYVFVTREDRPLSGLTLDDPRLKTLSIGVQMVGNDAQNTPPAHALSVRGLIDNVRGYMIYGDYARPNPPTAIIKAVADGDIDAAIVWGPLAGWYSRHAVVPLRIENVTPWLDQGQWPMVYDISMGVRRDDPQLRRKVETILESEKPAIGAILHQYGVPVVDTQ
ncbi:amino acid ABC transporter substrate-binding protein [Sphingomonas sp. Root710]|uniref:quinoprotein dehydrogenase-associated putative ABC transporter substrate-binding protein n=1 Tax=Sphingomonas sp. Root710 TaxID=1736594 RepID=UPI0006FD3717|nr:quinoprotein dehydrogenase-associated putative ABC transporter substrate-binding protein [Sphingomonas sp. Root710]KRB86568.1 amino acid ABC transporter substrate-binding protein [Sphingomonas sp. Root710]